MQGRHAERILLGLRLFEFRPFSLGVRLAAGLAVGFARKKCTLALEGICRAAFSSSAMAASR